MYTFFRKHFRKLYVFTIFFLLSSIFLLILVIPKIHSFLSQCNPVNSEILVIQSWIFDTMMDQATAEFNRSCYHRIILTGPIQSTTRGEKRLLERGISEDVIEQAFYISAKYHRTFREAYALKEYINMHYQDIKAVNIATGSVHGKKTHKIFKKILGDSIDVGIITFKSNNYDEKCLWFSPLGIKVTLEYFIGYLYALVWNFSPE